MKKGMVVYNVITAIMKLNLAALGRMEELVTEMKNDVNKLPAELVKLPCVTKQLNLSAYNILSKLANQKTPSNSKTEQHKTTTATTTTIVKLSTTTSNTANTTTTTTTATTSSNITSSNTLIHKSNTSVIQQTLNKYITSTKAAKSSSQSSSAVHSYALQAAGGSLLLYNAGGTQNTPTQYIVGTGGNAGSTQQFALAPSTGGSSGSSRHTQYIQGTDGNLYAITTRPSQGQNIVLSTSQGVLYWPVQQGTTTQAATTIIPQQSQQQYATTATMPGSAVIAKENSKGKLVPTAITVATPVTSNATTKTVVVPSTSTATQVSVITID